MENQILEILLGLERDMKIVKTEIQDVKGDLQNVKTDIQGVKTEVLGVKTEVQDVKSEVQEGKNEVHNLKTDIKEIKETVIRIEASQTEDVIGLLNVTKKKTDFEVEYLNKRVTEMDKRLFTIEKRIES